MEPADLVVLWRVYEHCNLACAFCGYSRELRRPRTVAKVDRILAFGRLLADHQRACGRRVLVSWLGGEPLLWDELPRLSHIFHEDFKIGLSVTTNGLPVESQRVRRALIDDYNEVTISVDGVGAFHDVCRKSPGLYDRLARSVAMLRGQVDRAGSRLLLKVNTILMRGNIADFESLCRAVAGWGVRELTFNQLGGNDRPEFYPANRLLPEQVNQFVEDLPGIRGRMSRWGLTIRGGARYLDRIAHTARGAPMPVDDCQPGTQFLFIDEQGLIAPCSFTTSRYGVSLDDVIGSGDLSQLPGLFALRRRGSLASACHDCPSTQVFQKFV